VCGDSTSERRFNPSNQPSTISIPDSMAYGTISSPTGSTGAPSGLESQPQQQLSLGHDEASTLTAEDSGNGQNSSQTIDHGTPSTTLWVRARGFYDANIGLFFVFLAQMCGSIVGDILVWLAL